MEERQTKFCKWCGNKLPLDAVVCTACGRQVEELKGAAPTAAPSIVVQNTNTSQSSINGATLGACKEAKFRNKWIALILCGLFGLFGIHKFYEGKVWRGLAYLFTFMISLALADTESEEIDVGCVLFIILLILVVCDFLVLCTKPNPYKVES